VIKSLPKWERKMTDKEPAPPVASSGPVTVRIAQEIPVVFADQVTNHVMGPGVIKCYFNRIDPAPGDPNQYSNVQVLQLIMPASGFVDMVAFFEHRLRLMVAANHVSQERVDERREFYSKYPAS
jgi:hypothetical protein